MFLKVLSTDSDSLGFVGSIPTNFQPQRTLGAEFWAQTKFSNLRFSSPHRSIPPSERLRKFLLSPKNIPKAYFEQKNSAPDAETREGPEKKWHV